MPRASRHYIPGGYAWHITHRCHKKEFLLKFARNRRRWLQWLFEARKRYGLSVVNCAVTSNHVRLLVRDNGGRDVIPNSIQLIAGRSEQESNQRKWIQSVAVGSEEFVAATKEKPEFKPKGAR